MGCWNETCFLTNLPILSGDKVIALTITRNTNLKTTFRFDEYKSTGTYCALTLPFTGTYNGYGVIENIENDTAGNFSIEVIKYHLERKTLLLSEGFEKNKDIHQLNLKSSEGLLKTIERGYLIDADGNPAYIIMMHIDAYKELITEVGCRIPHEFGSKNTKNLNELIRESVLSVSPEVAETKRNATASLFHMRKAAFSKFMADNFLRGWDIQLDLGQEWLIDTSVVTKFTEYYVFVLGLEIMRRPVIPTIGKGSQSSEMMLHKRLADFTHRHVINKELEVEIDDEFNPLKETFYAGDFKEEEKT